MDSKVMDSLRRDGSGNGKDYMCRAEPSYRISHSHGSNRSK
jgi:hypothetical protein